MNRRTVSRAFLFFGKMFDHNVRKTRIVNDYADTHFSFGTSGGFHIKKILLLVKVVFLKNSCSRRYSRNK